MSEQFAQNDVSIRCCRNFRTGGNLCRSMAGESDWQRMCRSIHARGPWGSNRLRGPAGIDGGPPNLGGACRLTTGVSIHMNKGDGGFFQSSDSGREMCGRMLRESGRVCGSLASRLEILQDLTADSTHGGR